MTGKSKTTQLITLIQSVLELKELTDIQQKFINIIQSPDINIEEALSFLDNDELYKNLNIEKLSINTEDIDLEGFASEVKKTIETSSSSESDNDKAPSTPPKAEAPTDLDTVYFDVKFIEEKRDIKIALRKLEQPLPDSVLEFINRIEKTRNAINDLLPDERGITWLQHLSGIARVGGTAVYHKLATSHLDKFKSEIVFEIGRPLKIQALKEYGKKCFIFAVILFILILIQHKNNLIPFVDTTHFVNGGFLLIGATIGSWLIKAISTKEVKLEDLRELYNNKDRPIINLTVIILLCLSFYFMFITQFISIKIGETFSTETLSSVEGKDIAFLIGLFLGLSDNTLGAKLTKQVESFITKI